MIHALTLTAALVSANAQPPAHPPAHAPAPKHEAPSLTSSPKLLERAEPMLEEGARLLAKGDVDGALEHFRKADPQNPDERAIVEYDVGSAQLMKAISAAQAKEPVSPGAKNAKPEQPKIDKQAIDDAKASFERAFGIAKDARIKSEAALAAGNASASAKDVDDAIAQYRKAIVADPTNERAKSNLRRVLDAKRAQPPPPPQNGDKNDDKKKNDDKNDDDKKSDQTKDDQQKNKDQQKQEQQKQDQQKQDQQKKDDDKKDSSKDQQKQDQQKQEQQKQEQQKQEQQKQEQPQSAKDKKKQDAKRLLDAMRARERPLTPLEMRGQEKQQKAKQGKDW